jgi:hypothetical protein
MKNPNWVAAPDTKHSGMAELVYWRIAKSDSDESPQYRLEVVDRDGDGRVLRGRWEDSEDVAFNVMLGFLVSKKTVAKVIASRG